MRVVTWNCNGAFRKKFKDITQLNSDIYVIQECENPATTKDEEYKKFASNYLWIGHKTKGLGIFAKDTITLTDNKWESYGLEWFISCNVDNNFTLLGVWGCGNYIEDIYVYLQIYYQRLKSSKNTLICGDFNSNTIWEKKHKRRTHSAIVEQLESLDLYSYYHFKENEYQGKESKATFYMYKNEEKPYHIDYFFGNREIFGNLELGKFKDWIQLSDHMPIFLDLI